MNKEENNNQGIDSSKAKVEEILKEANKNRKPRRNFRPACGFFAG